MQARALTAPPRLWVLIPAVLAALLAAVATAQPLLALAGGSAALALSAGMALSRRAPLWQWLATVTLGGYIILNYGFANLTLPGGVPVPVGDLLLFAAAGIVLLTKSKNTGSFLREPVVKLWLLFVLLATLHLVRDLPAFGGYAARDANFVFEGAALLPGFVIGGSEKATKIFLKSLGLIFLFNFLYSLTFPLGETIRSLSPVSGVFRPVALFGSYSHMPLFLVAGGLFFLLVAWRLWNWPRWVFTALGLMQLAWSLVFQARSMYLGLLVVMVLLLLFGGVGRVVRVGATMMIAVAGLLGALAVFGIHFQGRIGPVDSEFLAAHFRSLLLEPGTPALGSAKWRLQLLPGVIDRWTASGSTIAVGEGFGKPLIDFGLKGGVAVRQPHDTHLTILVRLGLAGMLLWALMNLRISALLWRALKRSPKRSASYDVTLWCFLFYVLGMLLTTVQPWLEFSYGAVPFFLLVGFAMGLGKRASRQPLGSVSGLPGQDDLQRVTRRWNPHHIRAY